MNIYKKQQEDKEAAKRAKRAKYARERYARLKPKDTHHRTPAATEANRKRIAATWPVILATQIARGIEEMRVEQEKFEKEAERLRVRGASRSSRGRRVQLALHSGEAELKSAA